jgi:hypothetical protein
VPGQVFKRFLPYSSCPRRKQRAYRAREAAKAAGRPANTLAKAALPTRSPNSTIQKTRCWSCPPSHVNHDHVEHRHAANVGRGPRRLAARAISRCRGAWTRASVATVGRFGFSKPGVTVTATADFVGESGVIPVEQFAPGAVNLELKQIAGISMKNVQ